MKYEYAVEFANSVKTPYKVIRRAILKHGFVSDIMGYYKTENRAKLRICRLKQKESEEGK